MTSQDKPGHILLDAMGFGMGCGCVQCTFQCCNINEARMLYDQLAIISPILVRLRCKVDGAVSQFIPAGFECLMSDLARPFGRHGLPLVHHLGLC